MDRSLRDFAHEYGWDPEIADLHQLLIKNKDKPETDEEIWQRIEAERTSFALAAFALGRKIHSSTLDNSYSGRRNVRAITSRNERDFPLKQYLRELVQNALDVRRPETPLQIRLKVLEDAIEFEHDGRPFRGPRRGVPSGEMYALQEIYETTKKGTFDSTGQFGIGFKGWMLFFTRSTTITRMGAKLFKLGTTTQDSQF